MKRQKIRWFRFFIVIVVFIALVVGAIIGCIRLSEFLHPTMYIAYPENAMEVKIPHKHRGEIEEETIYITRGSEVELRESGESQSTIRYDGNEFQIDNEYLVSSLDECVQIKYVYPRRLVNLRKEKNGELSDKIVKKGEQVEVVSVSGKDLDLETGAVKWYQVSKGKKTYWLSGYYVETSEELALQNHANAVVYSTFWDQFYGEDYSKDAYINQVDYKPFLQSTYEDNPIIPNINAMHTNLESLMKNKEYFLSLKDNSDINALVVEVKSDEGILWYKSNVPKKYMDDPSICLSYTVANRSEMRKTFKEFQDAGYYMIARIVTFKDPIFAQQDQEAALMDIEGNLLYHNHSYWPSAYSRQAWMYNVDIAKEVAQCHVNEIQFDYVRFPDGTLQNNLDGYIDFKNEYDESKVAALQGFLMYAKEELVPYEVYMGADLFAWPIVANDDQDIGQFLPAVATVADVISPMPYTDHFTPGSMGIDDLTKAPKATLYRFSSLVRRQLEKIDSTCIYRTWIQGYDFEPKDIVKQIEGINKAGYQGYMVWKTATGLPDAVEEVREGCIDSKLKED